MQWTKKIWRNFMTVSKEKTPLMLWCFDFLHHFKSDTWKYFSSTDIVFDNFDNNRWTKFIWKRLFSCNHLFRCRGQCCYHLIVFCTKKMRSKLMKIIAIQWFVKMKRSSIMDFVAKLKQNIVWQAIKHMPDSYCLGFLWVHK